jgi:hypothetical protein
MKKTRKNNKLSKKRKIRIKSKLTKRKRGGTSVEQIDLRQILITKPIIDTVKKYNPTIDLGIYKISKGEQGFPLTRMDRMMESDFNNLINDEPVELKVARTTDGKMIGTKIDGNMKKMYEIVNGRHRVTRAIIDGNQNINAKII